jgi:hypothetical protein
VQQAAVADGLWDIYACEVTEYFDPDEERHVEQTCHKYNRDHRRWGYYRPPGVAREPI